MRKLIILAICLVISGCSTIDTISIKKWSMGYRSYDPCIRCGEKWQQLPNWENEAIIRNARCAQGIDTANNCY